MNSSINRIQKSLSRQYPRSPEVNKGIQVSAPEFEVIGQNSISLPFPAGLDMKHHTNTDKKKPQEKETTDHSTERRPKGSHNDKGDTHQKKKIPREEPTTTQKDRPDNRKETHPGPKNKRTTTPHSKKRDQKRKRNPETQTKDTIPKDRTKTGEQTKGIFPKKTDPETQTIAPTHLPIK